ncbi:ATP-grasp domain-containing protein [Kribbella catacumbae]|uniref:ATP-grasp domain-containing protein n=1 Tax=Kribbella catacumbae TaxID=460086 RepID=UPI00037DBCD7|nr:hypothetical protein [Kribbella catacumbae]
MKTVLINRHRLGWTAGAQGSYLPVAASDRVLLTRTFAGGLDGWTAEAFPDVTVCDMRSSSRVEAAADWLISSRGAGRLVAIHEKDMLLAAALRERFRLPGLTVDETMPFRDKLLMKQLLVAAGYESVPGFRSLTSATRVAELPWAGPTVVKSRWGLGASDVRIVHDDAELWSAVTDLRLDLGDLEVEEFVPGRMVHCDSIIQNGQVTFSSVGEYLQAPGRFRDESHQGSVLVTEGPLAAIVQTHNETVLSALGARDGVSHVEFFVADDGTPTFCEAAIRPGGGGIDELVRRQYGINLIETAVQLQMGHPVTLPDPITPDPGVHGIIGVFQNVTDRDLQPALEAVLPGLVAYRRYELAGAARHATDYGHTILLRGENRADFDSQLKTALAVLNQARGVSDQ